MNSAGSDGEALINKSFFALKHEYTAKENAMLFNVCKCVKEMCGVCLSLSSALWDAGSNAAASPALPTPGGSKSQRKSVRKNLKRHLQLHAPTLLRCVLRSRFGASLVSVNNPAPLGGLPGEEPGTGGGCVSLKELFQTVCANYMAQEGEKRRILH